MLLRVCLAFEKASAFIKMNPTGMDIFGNFDHFVSNIVQNVKFLRLKKKKNVAKILNLKIVQECWFSTILGLTAAI